MSQYTKLNVYKFQVSQGHQGEVLKTFSKNVINGMQLYTQSNGDLSQDAGCELLMTVSQILGNFISD